MRTIINHNTTGKIHVDAFMINNEHEGETLTYKEYFLWNNIPFEASGFYLDDTFHLVVFGTMKEFWELKDRSITVGGRFHKNDLIGITKHEAREYLNKLLST